MNVEYDADIAKQVEIEVKYEGYINKAKREADRMLKMDSIKLPDDIDYLHVDNLALEARQKLNKIKPYTLGQASRISGINPSDIQVLAIYIKQAKGEYRLEEWKTENFKRESKTVAVQIDIIVFQMPFDGNTLRLRFVSYFNRFFSIGLLESNAIGTFRHGYYIFQNCRYYQIVMHILMLRQIEVGMAWRKLIGIEVYHFRFKAFKHEILVIIFKLNQDIF